MSRRGGRPGYKYGTSPCRFCQREIPRNVHTQHETACEKLEPLEREAHKQLAEKRTARATKKRSLSYDKWLAFENRRRRR